MNETGTADRPNRVRAADIVARRLHDAGCRFAFGIPGGEVIAMIDALERVGIRFILVRHENAAGFMAEGTWHRTGAPGILVATVGPGAANGVNVVANAWQDRVPLIVLTGCVDDAEAETYTHQVFDHGQLFRPITKASFKLSTGAAHVVADKAVALAQDDRPGPVHIDLPIKVTEGLEPAPDRPFRALPSPVGPAPGPDLETARRWLSDAAQPLVIAGLDVVNHKASGALISFCQAYGVPVIATYRAKGVVPDDDPLSLGGAGLSPLADQTLLPLVRKADLILLIGYDPIEMRIGWRDVWDPRTQRVIEISACGNDHYVHQASLTFVCHVGAGLEALRDGVLPRSTWANGEVHRARQSLAGLHGQGESWGPTALVETVREVAPRNALLTIDSGAHRILASQVWQTFEPRGVMQSTGLCTMGCALPLAIGAKLASPDRPVIAFTGDAGLDMCVGELATARDLGTPVIVVVFVDDSLALIELKQRKAGLANAGVDFGQTDYVALAQAYGGVGVWCDDRQALAGAFEAALGRQQFTLLACRIGHAAYDERI